MRMPKKKIWIAAVSVILAPGGRIRSITFWTDG